MADNNIDTKARRSFMIRFITGQLTATLIFIVGVISCYQGAMSGKLWLGPLVVILIALSRTVFDKNRGRELKVLLVVGGLGCLAESLMILLSIYTPDAGARMLLPWPLLPEWILALWINFGLKIRDYMWLMRGRPVLGAVMGFIFGILIFRNAAGMGLLVLGHGSISLYTASLIWAVIVPVLFHYAASVYPAFKSGSSAA